MQSTEQGLRTGKTRRVFLALSLAGAIANAAFSNGCTTDSGPAVTVHTGEKDVRVAVEVVRTPKELARGLMWRESLDEDAGMLFVFPDESRRSFWMKNTPLSLDIIYIRGDGTVGHVAQHTRPFSEAPIPSRGPARYVLEVEAGFSERHGLDAGDRISIPAELSSAQAGP